MKLFGPLGVRSVSGFESAPMQFTVARKRGWVGVSAPFAEEATCRIIRCANKYSPGGVETADPNSGTPPIGPPRSVRLR